MISTERPRREHSVDAQAFPEPVLPRDTTDAWADRVDVWRAMNRLPVDKYEVLVLGTIGINLSSTSGYSSTASMRVDFTSAGRLCGTRGKPAATPGLLISKNTVGPVEFESV
ncbi:MAG: hypothetical protein QM628_19085 [Propionicimonas sp.]